MVGHARAGGAEPGPGQRPAGKPSRRRLVHVLAVMGASVAGLLIVCGATLYTIGPDLIGDGIPEPSAISRSVEVLDRDGRLLRAYAASDERWRLTVAAKDVDPKFERMLLAYEDGRFYRHGGVDFRALLRAAWQGLSSGRIVSGGSTLTMQVARLLDCGGERSLVGKIHQILCAWKIERQLSKDEILSLYLLKAPYGGNIEGVRAAALAYFGKEPKRLTAAQAALLVALPQSPETRRPDRHHEAARAARDRVLARMVSAGVIASGEAEAAARERMPDRRRPFPMLAAHAADRAVSAAPKAIVHRLTIDAGLQARLEDLARERAGRLGPKRSVAIIAVDHATGEVLASVGSPGYLDANRQGAIDMTRAVRSPGSTLKPLIYGLGFEEGLAAPQSLIEDRPTTISGYAPKNFDHEFRGTVTVREALELSLNVPAVAMLDAVGPSRLMARMRAAGVAPELPAGEAPGLAIGLGGIGVTLHDLAGLYCAIARGGLSVPLREESASPAIAGAASTGRHVLSPLAAWYVSDILSGTPVPSSSLAGRIAFKTGTSYGYRDAWAVGFDGEVVIAVWTGRADGAAIAGATGFRAAAPILLDAFARLGRPPVPLAAAPRGAIAASGAELPVPLREVRVRRGSGAGEGLAISFPPDGAVLDIETVGAQRIGGVVVRLARGRPPFYLFSNEHLIATTVHRRQFSWIPRGIGFATLSVLDSTGASARVRVEIR
ncbi:penicillin-binding protein 1C [Breoghania corrubedonensis]|uniref:peptidoglycan glycosyltransferase n=1 Tax=Breoghania corrubedonensis TaxID=665038 RepID=A0A2T5VC59_9HYPH|nr:penicillin-binding protein 1C [Breoghania corrubedonensis]PTW61337.1 penicillin-binding protein 1C [Breoghania corrubedonensis]